MLSEQEINILLRSEQLNIQENMKTQKNGIEKIKNFRKQIDDFEIK